MTRRSVVIGTGVLAGALLIVQVIPVERTNPPVTRETRWQSDETASLARRACYDCHSNETVWPWYAYVAPASWLVTHDVEEGRTHLNFSTWDQPNEDVDEILEMVEDGEMPLRKYVLLHPEARLSAAEREALLDGLRRTLEADPPVAREEGEEGHGEDAH